MNMNQKLNFVGAFPTERRAVSEPGCSEKWARVAMSSSRNDTLHRHPDMVSNEQWFSHFYERVKIKKLAHEYKIRLASWNIGSLIGRLAELVNVMVRRNVSILCVQETKWVGEKAKIIESWGYKLWYTGGDRNRNGVSVIIDKQLLENVVEVMRKGDRILLVKPILGIYAP